MAFHESKKIGNQAEQFVGNILSHHAIPFQFNDNIDYDICISLKKGFDTKLEVKYDYMAYKTNNVAIEFANSKKNEPSGLFATKAHIWVHCLKDDNHIVPFICSVKNLKKLVEVYKPKKIITAGGDKNADLMLYDSQWFLKGMTKIANVEKGSLDKLLLKVKQEPWTKFCEKYK